MTGGTRANAKNAADFLNHIADEIIKREIPPQVAVTLFGVFGRQIVEAMVEHGRPQEEAISDVAGVFMKGLGVATLIKHVTLNDGGKPPTTH